MSEPAGQPEVVIDDPEDEKLITLARSSRARVGADEGAAVRDQDGRTYAAATVSVGALQLTAVEVAIAMAVTSGLEHLEVAVVITAADGFDDGDVELVRRVAGEGAAMIRAGVDGVPRAVLDLDVDAPASADTT